MSKIQIIFIPPGKKSLEKLKKMNIFDRNQEDYKLFRFSNSSFQQHAWPYAPYIIVLIICQKFNSTQVSPAQKYRLESVLGVFLHVMHVHLSTFLSDSISF